ncbi:MAG: PP2C family protein-serine/threonine phosphatase, partial [Ktedonobacteraceae bacterium]
LLQIQKGRKVHSLLEDCGKTDLCKILEQIISEADERVRSDGARRAGTSDLATTVAMVVSCRKRDTRGYTMVYAHVGDSRVYLLRNNESLKRLTSDDGLLAKLVENEVVNDTDALRIDQAMHAHQLSDTEYSYFRLRGGITQALGGPQPPTIHTDQVTVFPGDRILLCTDGIHDNLIDEEIEEILRTSTRTSAARLLVERSVQRSHQERDVTIRAKPDDMSAIVMTCRY